jgi:methionyl-tRNA formyltransferase
VSAPVTLRPRTVFFGSPAFAVPALERVAAETHLVGVVTQPDRKAGRGLELAEPAVKQAVLRLGLGVPILQPEKIRDGRLELALKELGGDLFVVVAYGRILPQSILDLPRLGAWNVHASVLPRLRGAAPIQWAIINGDSETGVSIMRMEAGLDTGPVAAVATMRIHADDTAGNLSCRLAVLGADLLAATLPPIVDGEVVLTPQDEARATLAPSLRKEDGQLDFGRRAAEVSARARGVDPWPGATAQIGGKVVKLFGPRAIAHQGERLPAAATAGTIVAIDASGLHVASGDEVIVFEGIQLPGRKRVSAAAAAAGRAIAVGERLG